MFPQGTKDYAWLLAPSAAGEDLSEEWRSEVARRHEEVLRGDVDLVPIDESLRKAFARVASVLTSDKVGA